MPHGGMVEFTEIGTEYVGIRKAEDGGDKRISDVHQCYAPHGPSLDISDHVTDYAFDICCSAYDYDSQRDDAMRRISVERHGNSTRCAEPYGNRLRSLLECGLELVGCN